MNRVPDLLEDLRDNGQMSVLWRISAYDREEKPGGRIHALREELVPQQMSRRGNIAVHRLTEKFNSLVWWRDGDTESRDIGKVRELLEFYLEQKEDDQPPPEMELVLRLFHTTRLFTSPVAPEGMPELLYNLADRLMRVSQVLQPEDRRNIYNAVSMACPGTKLAERASVLSIRLIDGKDTGPYIER